MMPQRIGIEHPTNVVFGFADNSDAEQIAVGWFIDLTGRSFLSEMRNPEMFLQNQRDRAS